MIFITENDVLKSGLPIYHIDRIVQETGEPFGDEAHIIYVNSQIKDETELGKLMHDFSCTDPKDMYYKILADRVRYFKEDEEGVLTMCREMENMRKESSHEKAVEIAKRMLASGKLTYEDIAVFTDLTLEEIKALAVRKLHKKMTPHETHLIYISCGSHLLLPSLLPCCLRLARYITATHPTALFICSESDTFLMNFNR